MKKITALLLLVVCVLSLCACSGGKENDIAFTEPVATVNEIKITAQEIDFFTMRGRTEILDEYMEKYEVKDLANFWSTEFDGKTPQTVLNERALNQAAEAKIKYSEMQKKGIYKDISWEYLRKEAEKYNSSLGDSEEELSKKIDMSSFYLYYLEEGEKQLKDLLAQEGVTDYDAYIKDIISKAVISKAE